MSLSFILTEAQPFIIIISNKGRERIKERDAGVGEYNNAKTHFVIQSMHYVYVLLSLVDRTLYAGYTDDLKQRLEKYNAGK